jgi:tRNA (guanine37-N1)-methyltransferase
VCAHNIRDFANNKHNRVDDTPYGGGFGMLMMAPPVYDCYEFVKSQVKNELGDEVKSRVIYMSPQGKVLTQQKAQELAEYDNLIILCGHYEGIDSRVLEEIVDEEISIGDYVLTGGELPACILVDCISRLKDGVLSDKKCYEDESISSGLLEYPQYTRPYEFHGKKVPDVLISGNHAEIDKWRAQKALEITKIKRPDLLD